MKFAKLSFMPEKLPGSLNFCLVLIILSVVFNASAQVKKDYSISPVKFTEVDITDQFWLPRMETSRKVTLPYALSQCEETGRISNFAKAGGLVDGKFEGIFFNDSDVFKVVEGAAYTLALAPDPKLEKYLDDLIVKIAAAQEDDGYLYTARTLQTDKYSPPGGKERWSDIAHGHELYNVGHMYEAAVAHYQATGKRNLLDVAIKNADLVCSVFGPDGRHDPPGCQVIEIGLGRLYRVTGDQKYLKTAKFFLDQRGNKSGKRGLDGKGGLYGEYSQDHKPVIEQDEAVGHAVRAAYMYCGMADIAALTGDLGYVKAIKKIWNNITEKKLYITAGIGATRLGEAFGKNYELPNLTAYNETCAAISYAMFNHRMFLMTGEGKYMDIVERILYNGFLSGISLEGKNFFYPNPLASLNGTSRSPWFSCACCPSNIVRFVPSIPGYAYASIDNKIYVNLYMGSTARMVVGGNKVVVKQETNFPWNGKVRITVEPDEPTTFEMRLRIPGWARNEVAPGGLYSYAEKNNAKVKLKVKGKAMPIRLHDGYVAVSNTWKHGDVIELDMPMKVRRVLCDKRVEMNMGKVAIERGPIVYCLEGHDVEGGKVLSLILEDDVELKTVEKSDLLGGVITIKGTAASMKRTPDDKVIKAGQREFTAIPYYAWAHRGRSPMTVWIARNVNATIPAPAETIAVRAKVSASKGSQGRFDVLSDQYKPKNSDDRSAGFLHWWPHKNTKEWVQYNFDKKETVSEVRVYWFEDIPDGEVKAPLSWKVLYKDGDKWKPVRKLDPYTVDKDMEHSVKFQPITADAMRLEIQSHERYSVGLHEWSVE